MMISTLLAIFITYFLVADKILAVINMAEFENCTVLHMIMPSVQKIWRS